MTAHIMDMEAQMKSRHRKAQLKAVSADFTYKILDCNA